MMQSKIIVVTGGTGSGKSSVCEFIKSNGGFIIDADEISHQVINKGKPAYQEVVSEFGLDILDENENIVRSRLGELVFQNAEKLKLLTQCMHKYIEQEIIEKKEHLQKVNERVLIFIDMPLLNENILKLSQEVWFVYAKEEARVARIMERDEISKEFAQARISAQPSKEQYEKVATKILNNMGDLKQLELEVKKLMQE